MPDVHLTFELLEAHARGDLNERDLFWIVIRHLRAECPPCDVEIQAYEDEGAERRGEARPVGDVPPATRERVAAFVGRLEGLLRQAEEGAARSPRELRELVTLVESELQAAPPGSRVEELGEEALGRVRRARTRFRSIPLAWDLLDEVRASLPDRPRRALALSRLAERVTWRIPNPDRLLTKLRGCLAGLALAHQGNALRVLDDLRAADRRFAQARDVLDSHGVADAEVLGEVDALEGSLRRDQRQFPEAEAVLRRAAAHWIAAEEPVGLARTLLKLGSLYFHWGRPNEALEHADAALSTLPADGPVRLRLCAAHNQVFYLCELGHFEIAAELLAEVRPLYERFEDLWVKCRLAWVEGKIAAGLGHFRTAAERLESAREKLTAAGALYDTALVSLELAEVHLVEGRNQEARRLASETVRLFAALEVPREAAAALAQLRRALEQKEEEVTTRAGLTAILLRTTAQALRFASSTL